MELRVTSCEIEDSGVGIIRLDRPGRGNSWTSRMNAEYRWLMASMERDPRVRVIVVTGAGRQFCVGADFKALDFYKEGDKDYVDTVKADDMAKPGYGVRPEFDHEMIWQWGLRKPVIAAINGACAGIAVGLVAFCDLRYAAEGIKMTTSTPRIGLPAEYGLAWVLPRIVGIAHAADILLTGRVFTSDEAKEMGFLNGLFPQEGFLDAVLAIARNMATTVSPTAAAVSKNQLYGELMMNDAGEAIEDSKRRIGRLMQLPDYKEGVNAMTEKRAAAFAPVEASVAEMLDGNGSR